MNCIKLFFDKHIDKSNDNSSANINSQSNARDILYKKLCEVCKDELCLEYSTNPISECKKICTKKIENLVYEEFEITCCIFFNAHYRNSVCNDDKEIDGHLQACLIVNRNIICNNKIKYSDSYDILKSIASQNCDIADFIIKGKIKC